MAHTDSTLRTKLIRQAHANPSLRPHLLPLIAAEGGSKLAATLDTEALQQKLDKMSSLLIQIRTSMPPGYARIREIEAVSDALVDLRKAIQKGDL
jgi:hypothetical protein